MSRNNDGMDTSMFLWVVFLIVMILIVPAVYSAKSGAINGFFLSVARWQIKTFVPFFEDARKAWGVIEGFDPASLTWERMQGILSYTGKWIRWPFAFILCLLGAASIVMGGRTSGFIRRFNMKTLLSNNAETYPCLKPVVGRGSYLLSPESFDSGPWRIARTPLQFAVEHELLIDANGAPFSPDKVLHEGLATIGAEAYGNAVLDEEKALSVLQAQLGKPFTGTEHLSPVRKVIACAFLAYAFGDKKGCLKVLDSVSLAYTEKDLPACSVLETNEFQKNMDDLFARYEAILKEPAIIRHSAFELPWLMALLTRARKKGVLSSSQFLWLRPLDRPLWYALNQCGGRAAWAEGFAAWAHYAAEEKARKSLSHPHVAPAIASIKDALASQGWFTDTPRPLVQPPASDSRQTPVPASPVMGVEPVPDMVFSEAEEEADDYDANEDSALAQEHY